MEDDPNGYTDMRWYELIDRMWQHVREKHPLPKGEQWHGDNPDCLTMLIKCYWEDKYQWKRVDVTVPHLLRVSTITQCPPPVGHWRIVSQNAVEAMGVGLPVGYFRDGIPF